MLHEMSHLSQEPLADLHVCLRPKIGRPGGSTPPLATTKAAGHSVAGPTVSGLESTLTAIIDRNVCGPAVCA